MKKRRPYIPEEVLMDILSRVPHAVSLLRFSAVCKTWRSLIKSPEFISKFIHHHPTSSLSIHPYSDPSISYPYTLLFNFQSPDYGSDILIRSSKHFRPCRLPARLSFVRASSGDLLLCYLSETEGLLVCNPLTRECFAIPFVRLSYVVRGKHKLPFGLAGDRLTRRYRVVVVTECLNHVQGLQIRIKGFSSEVQMWRATKCLIPLHTCFDNLCDDAVDGGSGVLYFPLRCRGRISAFFAIDAFRFDDHAGLVNEIPECRVVHMPAAKLQQPADLKMEKFGVVRGRLRVACWVRVLGGHLRVKIWELRYNGGGERDDQATTDWVLVQDFHIEPEKEDKCKTTFVVGLHPNNGDIIFVVRGSDICKYEIRQGKCEKIGKIPNIPGPERIKENLQMFLNVFTLLHLK